MFTSFCNALPGEWATSSNWLPRNRLEQTWWISLSDTRLYKTVTPLLLTHISSFSLSLSCSLWGIQLSCCQLPKRPTWQETEGASGQHLERNWDSQPNSQLGGTASQQQFLERPWNHSLHSGPWADAAPAPAKTLTSVWETLSQRT